MEVFSKFGRLKGQWLQWSVTVKLVVVNVAIFLILRILAIVGGLSDTPSLLEASLGAVELPGSWPLLVRAPWTLLTYMFVQFDVTHLLFNMIWLYWFGTIFTAFNLSWRLLPLYIYGGIAGALVFMLTAGGGGCLIGSSAAISAIVAATAMIIPNYSVQLLLIGNVKLKWIAIVTIGIDVLFVSSGGSNLGGHIAHLGGALMGVVYALALRRGTDVAWPLKRATEAIRALVNRPRRAPKAATTTTEVPSQATIDAILDKIRRSGYTSLTPAERATLFSAGSKNSPPK